MVLAGALDMTEDAECAWTDVLKRKLHAGPRRGDPEL
jgi:hypothetical protein